MVIDSVSEITVLGIETSCDETAAAVVRRTEGAKGIILSNIVRSQLSEHSQYGGVVPEIAARAHVDVLDQLVELALQDAGVDLRQCDAIAVTAGPGLIGGLMVGLMTAKAMSLVAELPLVAVNHLEGHALTAGLTEEIEFPYLLLLVSGGHTQLLIVEDVGCYHRLGTTVDDALGEAFDKTAKLLGLGFPGGPEVERWAREGNPKRFNLPQPMKGRTEPHFSFSGLKTALRQNAQKIAPLADQDIADLCASFELAVAETVTDRVNCAMHHYEQRLGTQAIRRLVVAGGVAANIKLGQALTQLAELRGYQLHIPPLELCTDNAAMIAWAGAERYVRGFTDPLDISARARWPLDSSAPAAIGAGVKA